MEFATGSETVLLVDDEDLIIDVGRQILEKLGYKVLIARSGKEALDVYQASGDTIALVILDMVMPDMDGGITYNHLKDMDSNVRVLLSSGYSINDQAQEILDRGCNGFIQKPFNLKFLSENIRNILAD